ncbi:hypothetical protein [Streptomyces sp. KR80]|uniref:hypothetical protein n=1 Tax=Streptomyces sp. KR80 TaxID=3457426 RepID=UPI003FD1BA31
MERSPYAEPYAAGGAPAPAHCHAYAWVGPRWLFDKEGERRPEYPAAFAASEVTPLRPAQWLRKPRRMIRSTFTDPEEAAAWIRARTEEVVPSLLHPEEAESPPLARREAVAADMLRWGGDVVWGFHLRDGRFASYALICCPNLMEPELACPEGLASGPARTERRVAGM